MRVSKRKPTPVDPNRRVAIPGQDGKTLGQRVREAMAFQSGKRGQEYKQSDLVDAVRQLSGSDGDTKLQQAISAVMTDKVSKSAMTPYIARACEVDGIWLASGLGSMIPKN